MSELARVFDIAASREAADAAIAEVDEHAAETFRRDALDVVRWVAERSPEFTTDRVWFYIERRQIPAPREPRALGPIMRRAQGREWIEDTGRVHLTVQQSAHRRPKRIWRSLLYRGAP